MNNSKLKELKKHFEEMERFEKLADIAESKMLENPTDKKLESDFDSLYKKEWNNWKKAVDLLKTIIGCNDNIAKKMIAEKREEIRSLLSANIE